MSARVRILGVYGVGQRLGRLLKQSSLFLLRLLVIIQFAQPGPLRGLVEIIQSEGVEHDDHERRREIGQRQTERAVSEELQDRCDRGQGNADDQGTGQARFDLLAVLYDRPLLQYHHQKRHQVAKYVPGRPLIVVSRIKGVIQMDERREHEQDKADGKQTVCDLQRRRRARQFALVDQNVDEISRHQKRYDEQQEINGAVADPDHIITEPAGIALKNIAIPVKNEQQHGRDLHGCQNMFGLARQGMGEQGHDRQDPAHAAKKQHDIRLMHSDKVHSVSFLIKQVF